MSRWVYLGLTVLAAVAVVYIYLHRQQLGLVSGPSSTVAQDQSGQPVNTEMFPAHIVWQKVDRTPDGFQVQMPENPQEIQIPAYNSSGGADQVGMLFSTPDAETTYSIAWADDPPVVRAERDVPQQVLDTARDGALARTQTSLVNESKTTVQGFPARDFTGRNGEGGLFDARMILAGKRLYMLIAAFPSGSAMRQQDVTQFFDDFRLTPSGREAAPAANGD